MRFIGILLTLLLVALLAYFLVTGAFSSPQASLQKAAHEAGVPGGSPQNREEIKQRVEGMLQKSAEEQKKVLDEATR